MKPARFVLVLALLALLARYVRLNLTGSVARGFYWVARTAPERRDLAEVQPAGERWARWWGGPPPSLAKRIAAVGGDRVCVEPRQSTCHLLVAGRQVGQAVSRGRCASRGCSIVASGEVWLVGDAAQSDDSRAFGPVPASAVTGRLVPLLTE
ncbi:MAG TPA: S26 family signal peptidase [Thermoanaerobaculia bacterium]|nr:S26 family signal peptidase [Thermoanaerobaculia bacterium]